MRMIVEAFAESLELGLAKYNQIVPMIPTFVFGWPSGQETGDYLAVDLGGTNLRVCLVTLQGDGKFELTQTKYRLTEEQKQDEGQKLFDFCAECLKAFVESNTGDGPGMLKEGQVLPLGFTVSDAFLIYLSETDFDIRFARLLIVLVSMHVSRDLILGSECRVNHDFGN
ncbi:hexokinase-domain-containing protein [Butyriboletus roseoflavus]|nr:hexokinase-domain-containing protein [Butyriboletus roseoflavus]